MNTLRGVKCNICGDIGKHYSSSCPERVNVGVPIGLRQHAPLPLSHCLEEDCATMAATACLTAQELTVIIRKNPGLPSFLRCRACLALPLDAVWCQCCDIFVCSMCLGPPHEAWVCPLCETFAADSFHVIKAVRRMLDAWFQAAAELVDPYSVSSDDDEEDTPAAAAAAAGRKRLRS